MGNNGDGGSVGQICWGMGVKGGQVLQAPALSGKNIYNPHVRPTPGLSVGHQPCVMFYALATPRGEWLFNALRFCEFREQDSPSFDNSFGQGLR